MKYDGGKIRVMMAQHDPPRHTLTNLMKQTRLLGIFSNDERFGLSISRVNTKANVAKIEFLHVLK